MKRLLFLFFIACAPVSFAQVDNSSGRAHVFEFLANTPNPRATGLGNAFVAMKNDLGTLFTNPAGIATLEARDSASPVQRAMLGFTSYGIGISEGYLVYGSRFNDRTPEDGTYAIGIQYSDFGTMDGFNSLGDATGTFGASEVGITVAYANTIPEQPVQYGLGVKFISSSLVSGSGTGDYSSAGVAADVGVMYVNEPMLFTIGFSAVNIGTQTKTYNGFREQLPFNLQFGVSKKLERLPLTLHLAFHNLTRDLEGRDFLYAFNDFSVGGEFQLGKALRLRVGIENQKRRELKTPAGQGLAGFSFGVGFEFQKFMFDYGLNGMGPSLPDRNRLGVTYSF